MSGEFWQMSFKQLSTKQVSVEQELEKVECEKTGTIYYEHPVTKERHWTNPQTKIINDVFDNNRINK